MHRTNHAPDPSVRQVEILSGLLLGAGAYTGTITSPRVDVTVDKESTAEWISDELDSLVARVDPDGEAYRVTTPSNPKLNSNFRRWYSEQADPRPPSTSILTPLMANVWFSVNGEFRGEAVFLKASYGHQNLGWHRELFREAGFNPWREDPNLVFPVEQVDELFEYLESPLPGIADRWPD